MRKARWWGQSLLWSLGGLILLLLLPSISSAAQQPAGEYVGADTCMACHPDEATQFQKTPMAILLSEKYPQEQRGCEACHGPGSAHMEAIGEGTEEATERSKTLIYSFPRHSPQENATQCLACHQKDEEKHLFGRSRHLGAGVTCVDCHDPHRLNPQQETAKPAAAMPSYFSVPQRAAEREWLNGRLLKEKQPQLCYSCHRDIESQFQLPIRHRVNEGLVKCSDCHNAHGSLAANELRAAGTEACTTCHVEKRGPFVYEHATVRVEGCTGCHTPHGAINANLLKRRQQRQLCLECHTAPEGLNVPHPRLGFQEAGACTRCHIEIHGSNYQKQFLR